MAQQHFERNRRSGSSGPIWIFCCLGASESRERRDGLGGGEAHGRTGSGEEVEEEDFDEDEVDETEDFESDDERPKKRTRRRRKKRQFTNEEEVKFNQDETGNQGYSEADVENIPSANENTPAENIKEDVEEEKGENKKNEIIQNKDNNEDINKELNTNLNNEKKNKITEFFKL